MEDSVTIYLSLSIHVKSEEYCFESVLGVLCGQDEIDPFTFFFENQ